MPTGDPSALAFPSTLPLTPPGSQLSTVFDHPFFATAGIERPRAKLPETNLGFAFVPSQVSMYSLRDIVSAALRYRATPTNLVRVLELRYLIEPTGPAPCSPHSCTSPQPPRQAHGRRPTRNFPRWIGMNTERASAVEFLLRFSQQSSAALGST